jgi:dimethylargininase
VPATTPAAALVRTLSPRINEAELTHVVRTTVDVSRARRQHATYLALLVDLGLELVHLPPLPSHPDGVFVEDTVVIVGPMAVLMRPGAASRRGEVDSVAGVLERRGYRLERIVAPGTMDGGDVLQVGDTVFVGRTARTNAAAVEQLTGLLAPLGRTVIPVPVHGVLHLKTAATALPDGSIVALPGTVPPGIFGDRAVLTAPEPAGGDVLVVGDGVVVSTAAPRTAAMIAARGFAVEVVGISELEKVEAGVTCPSVLLPAGGAPPG